MMLFTEVVTARTAVLMYLKATEFHGRGICFAVEARCVGPLSEPWVCGSREVRSFQSGVLLKTRRTAEAG